MRDEYGEAVERYEQALPLYRTIGARRGEANCLHALGEVHYMRDEYGEAVERYEQALQLGRSVDDFASQLNSLRGLALTFQAQNNLTKACEYAKALLALADSHVFFKTHPVVQGWRATFASWGCDGI
jgi:tetratricopeptide (TPR) repeat protein